MRKKKICFIAHFPPPMHGLSKAVETLYNSELSKEYDFEKLDIKNNKKFLYNVLRILKSKADLFYFTISQTKGGNLRDLIIFKLLDLQKKKCLIHIHGGYYRQLVDKDLSTWQRKANYRAISKISGAIVLGPSLKCIFQGMLPDEKIYTVPNCVDDKYLMTDGEFEEKLRTLPDRKIKHVLYLSNFIKSKGYPEVLEMAKLEKERVDASGEKRFHFDFAGVFFQKSEEDFFWDYIRKNELEDFITYHGIVSGDQKRDLLKKSDVFLLLTRYTNEGQPISILEAMGNGMEIITTNHAGITDLVKDSVNGVVVNKNNINIEDIYNKLLTSSDISIVEKKNRDSIMLFYTQDKYINTFRKVFEVNIC